MDALAILKVAAPWIGGALGGPLGGLAVTAATNALGLSEKTSEALKTALAGTTPEQMLALKTADQNFALQMQELGFKQLADLEAIAAGDRANARGLQMGTHSQLPAVLSLAITVGYFAVLFGIMQGWLKINDSQALLLMLGSLSTAWAATISFWFGTTRESGDKTRLLAQAPPISGG